MVFQFKAKRNKFHLTEKMPHRFYFHDEFADPKQYL